MWRKLTLITALALLSALYACGRDTESKGRVAHIVRARELLTQYGCGTCHQIPHVPEARGSVGPPLSTIGSRSYIAGVLPNTPENMMAWIRDPQKIDPRTAMPNVGVTADDARAIADYLYTLR